MTSFTEADFKVEKRASGWAVARSDGALIAIGMRTKKEAMNFLDEHLALMD